MSVPTKLISGGEFGAGGWGPADGYRPADGLFQEGALRSPPLSPPDHRGFADFARRGGSLRVSFTPRCQLRCWFCHNEGEIPPRITHGNPTIQPRPRLLSAKDYLTSIDSLTGAGIRRVFFTGGEPLLSPLAKPVLQALPSREKRDYSTTLITNGLRLANAVPWLTASGLDRVKISLHYFSDESIKEIAGGKPGDIAKIKAGIEASVGAFPEVELNLLLQDQNQHEVPAIIDYARALGVNVQIIELVDTAHNATLGGNRIDSSGISEVLRTLAESERVITSGTGQGKRCFAIGKITVEVIDATLPRYHVGQCASCPVKSRCVEGFWSLRLDAAGTLLPCLLRPDLRLDVIDSMSGVDPLAASVCRHIDAFAEGAL